VLVYFTAKWNPACSITDEHINMLAKSYDQIEIVKIDSDEAPKIAKHYHVRAEPEFIFCLNGDEIVRQTGPNKEGLI
jgi:thioredoxin-like negative regulator of GroEL